MTKISVYSVIVKDSCGDRYRYLTGQLPYTDDDGFLIVDDGPHHVAFNIDHVISIETTELDDSEIELAKERTFGYGKS